jgi:hypothetical protein
MTDKEQRHARLQEIAPHVWSMYLHVFEGRSKLENKLNYFLAINTVILLVVLQLLQSRLSEWSLLHIVPVFLLLLPVLLLLANFLSRPLRVPWLEKEPLSQLLDSGEFYPNWIASIFGSAYGSFAYQKRIIRLIKVCLSLVAGALCWLAILFILSLCGAPLAQTERLALLLLMAGACASVVWLLIVNRVEFPHQTKSAEVYGFLAQWLEGTDKQSEKA